MAQSVNLWGATYSDVPAIEVPKSGGGMASFTDVTDTTAAASDVATGKYFYTAAGVRTQGTGSGGAGAEYTRTVIAPQQTVSPSSAMQQMTLTSSGLIEDAKSYIVTVDNVEWLTTCETLWSANYCIGDVRYFLEASPSSAIYPFGAICENGVIYACFATTGSHTIKIERLDFVTGGTTLTTKNITANGTYNASSDSADGYSSVTVNVSGGGGLEYEEGTWTPAADTHEKWFSFTRHTEAPFFFAISDATGNYSSVTNSYFLETYCNYQQLFGQPIQPSSSASEYGIVLRRYRGTNTSSFTYGTTIITKPWTDSDTTATSSSRYWAQEEQIRVTTTDTTRYWRAGRTYKWIAVWRPTT